MAETLTVALRVAEEAIEEAIAKAEEFSDSLVRRYYFFSKFFSYSTPAFSIFLTPYSRVSSCKHGTVALRRPKLTSLTNRLRTLWPVLTFPHNFSIPF